MVFTPPPRPDGFDPRGFAVGVLANRLLERAGLRLRQWRWFYGALSLRENPFEDHVALNGKFVNLEGAASGFYPGDHKGCMCSLEPVYQREGQGVALARRSVAGESA